MLESLRFGLQLVTLLGKLIYNQSMMQHCPLEGPFPNFTAVAGSPFFFNILLHATLKHMRHFQIFCANGKDLPHWMVYRHQSGHLLGLALAEDCGTYHLQLDITGHSCIADFYLHILDARIPVNSSLRDTLQCPGREINVWGNLLLKMDPVSLNASQRIHLVNTMADYLNQQQGLVSLFSSNILHLKKLQVCRQSHLSEKHFENKGAIGNTSEILWPLGCQSQEQLLFYPEQLQNTIKTIMLPQGLDIAVLSWRLLCPVKLPYKVKRELQEEIQLNVDASQQITTLLVQQTSLMEDHYTQSTGQSAIETYGMTLEDFIHLTDTFSKDQNTKLSFESTMSDQMVFSSTMLESFEQFVAPSSPVTLNSYSATFSGIHVVTITQWLTTSLTPGPHQDGTSIWTEVYGDSHPESDSHSALSSMYHSGFRQDLTPPSVSNIYLTEKYETSYSDHTLESSNGSPSTQMFSPTALSSQSSKTDQYETTQHLPPTVSGVIQEVMSQLNSTITSISPTTLVSHVTQNELESSLHFSYSLEPTTTMFTPPLPSELSSNQLTWTSGNANLGSTVEPLKDSSMLQDVSSITLQSATETHFKYEITESDLCSDQNGQADCSGILLTSELTTHNLQTESTFHISTDIQQTQILSDVQQMNSNLLTQFPISPFSSIVSNHATVSLHGLSSSVHSYLNTSAMTTATTSVTYTDQLSTYESIISATESNHFGTTAPSTAQQPSTAASTIHGLQMSDGQQVSSMTTELPGASQKISPTFSQQNATQNELDSSLYFSYSLESTAAMFTTPLPSEYSSSELPWTSGNTNLASTVAFLKDTSMLQDTSSIMSFQSQFIHEITSEQLTHSNLLCSDENGLLCSNIFLESHLTTYNLKTFDSVLEVSKSVSTLEQLHQSTQSQQTDLSFNTFLSSVPMSEHYLPTVSFWASESLGYATASEKYEAIMPSSAQGLYTATSINLFGSLEPSFPICNSVRGCTSTMDSIPSTVLTQWTAVESHFDSSGLPPFSTVWQTSAETMEYSSFNLKSGSLEISDFKNLASTPVQSIQNYLSATTINLFESLEPSFPLCSNVGVNGCTSTWESMTLDSKQWTPVASEFVSSAEIIKYSSINFKSSSIKMTDLISSVAHTSLASHSSNLISATSAQSIPNYLSATHQMPPDTWTPSYVSGRSVIMTYTLLPLSSSALMGHCVSERSSLLICQPSIQVSVSATTQSTSFSLFTGISTTLLHAGGHSSLDIIKPSSTSATVSSSVNFPPQVLQTIPALTATIGFPFSYSIQQNTFTDPEDGAADALSLEMTLIDGPPPNVGSWLALDGLRLHGVPLEVDTHFAPQHVLLSARDAQGLSASLTLTVDLYRDPVEPCHVFTLTARLSLYSLLLHRQKVELLLTKLSHYFNSSSNHHLSVVSITSGSAVVSWYNYSLCSTGQCNYDEIRNMWLEMSSVDKAVNPTFRNAMLPDFPIINVGPVTYRKDCFTQTPTPGYNATSKETTSNHSTSTPIPVTSEQVTTYGTLTGMFIALLVICALILIVLLVAVILYFCQRRPRVVAIWPASRMLSVQSRDLRVLRPRPAPLLQPEIPPPPLKLWISLTQDESPRQQGLHRDPLQPPTKYKFANI